MRKCYAEPGFSDTHRGKSQCVVSDKYKLIFYLVPKTGSSTNRIIFREKFEGSDGNVFCKDKQSAERRAYRAMTTIRDPYSRFFSSYMEAEFRAVKSDGPHDMKKFDWWDLDDPQERFYKFVDYWYENGMAKTLDTHLRLQAPMLSWYDGSMHRLDYLLDIENIDDRWDELTELFDLAPKEPTI
eukprot:UN26260